MVISRRSKRSDSDSNFMRSGATSRNDNRTAPAVWTWFLAGIFAGLFIAFLIYLGVFATPSPATATVPPLASPTVAKTETKVTETAPSSNSKTPTEAAAPKFEFYDVLTQNSGKARQPAPLPPSQQTEVSPAVQPPAVPVSTTGAYVLQLAAFRDAREADSFKAHVASLGFSAGIEVANVNGTAWHRVRMGFENAAQMNEIKAQLEQHSIAAVAVKF